MSRVDASLMIFNCIFTTIVCIRRRTSRRYEWQLLAEPGRSTDNNSLPLRKSHRASRPAGTDPKADMRHHGSISRCAIVTRPCSIHPRSALCAENGSQDPTSTYLDPRRSANIQIVLAAVSVEAVPARSLQTQPSSVRQASDIALSSEVARQSHSKKALCFHHPPGRSLSLECCRVLNARLLTWADRHIMSPI